ncbi:hypothetical protein Thpro_021179 [Acidihalobacter prosperus]|uniref:DUF218 domain-containing protein n=1 Tax=Acidihalobacter prosperus TaxID=160660 RepID=A0A1A6C6D9_9GAMM|nr:hypothetical protein Thpro_021179 [Acidihalobacter prosperus]
MLELLILPPAGPLLVLGLGLLLLLLRRRRIGGALAGVGFVLAYAGSIPAVVYPLADVWESHNPPLRTVPDNAQAIVVIGGGSRPAPAYGDGDTVTLLTLQRVRYAAWLARRSGLPILVSGGRDWFGERYSEAELMSHVLADEFHLKTRWEDTRSRSTWGNARESAKILKPLGITRVLLVTQAWHMPRAMWAFRHAGLDPVAAPVGFANRSWAQRGALGWIPQTRAATTMAEVAHEVVGLMWYRLRAWRAGD